MIYFEGGEQPIEFRVLVSKVKDRAIGFSPFYYDRMPLVSEGGLVDEIKVLGTEVPGDCELML